jgi:uncharacterized LabA/DUF88 family protein/cold shock CspA family protein
MDDVKLRRIGVFYDGNYFLKVSNYYNYEHPRKARISIEGLHNFVRHQIAKEESLDIRLCQVVDAHYFRGRLSAYDAKELNKLYNDRIFDDILMNEGVITHYLPLRSRNGGKREEKGIDVWLALEAYELTLYKKFDVLVLIACDGDYVPLIRKLNTLGTRVMVLNWDFKYIDERGETRETRTSQELLEEVTYPIAMHEIIDSRVMKNDPMVNSLFVSQDTMATYRNSFNLMRQPVATENGYYTSSVINLKNGYGFIVAPPNNLYFSHQDLIEGDFNDLRDGDVVEYTLGKNERGDCAKNVRKISSGVAVPANGVGNMMS